MLDLLSDNSHLGCNNRQHHRTILAHGMHPPCHYRIAGCTPYSHLDYNKGRGTGFHLRTHGSTPDWGPAHIVRSHIDYLDRTVGSSPAGGRAPPGNSAGAHTNQTRNFAPARNDPRTGSTAAVAAAVVADHIVARQSHILPGKQKRLEALAANFGKPRAAFCQSRVHSQTRPFSSETRYRFPAVPQAIFVLHAVGSFSGVTLV